MPNKADEMNDFIAAMKQTIIREVERRMGDMLYIAQVEDLRYDETYGIYFIQATKLSDGETKENIKLSGPGIGNLKGLIKVPRLNEFGIVADLFGEAFWLGNVFDTYTDVPDRVINMKDGMMVQNKEGGGFMLFSKDDNISINTEGGAKVIFKKDGSFKIFNKDNYGIECDASGNMKLRGVTIDGTQSAGSYTVE